MAYRLYASSSRMYLDPSLERALELAAMDFESLKVYERTPEGLELIWEAYREPEPVFADRVTTPKEDEARVFNL